MSLVQLQIAIDDNRTLLESGGIRGMDLDFLLDPKVDHRSCLANFERMVVGPLSRWCEVMSSTTVEQLEFLKTVEPRHQKVVAAKEARRALKNYFKGHVLCFWKDAERRAEEERQAALAASRTAKRDRENHSEGQDAEEQQ